MQRDMEAEVNNQPSNGFSLLELLVVLLIMSVSMGLFFGMNFRQKESVVVRSFASELTMFLAAARSQAILDGLDNACVYKREKNAVIQELNQKAMDVPEEVQLVRHGSEGDDAEEFVLALFQADGSLILEDFVLSSGDLKYFPEADPFMGRVRFEME